MNLELSMTDAVDAFFLLNIVNLVKTHIAI